MLTYLYVRKIPENFPHAIFRKSYNPSRFPHTIIAAMSIRTGRCCHKANETPSYLIFAVVFSYFVNCLVFNTRVSVYFRATVSALSCLVVPAFICIDLLVSFALKIK